jgi:hypothetical protein
MTLAGPPRSGDFVQDVADHAAEADRFGAVPWKSLDILHRGRSPMPHARRA